MEVERSADLSPCGTYRYTLERWWDREKPAAVFVMLNPSTADAEQDDATIRRCVGFAQRWELGGLVVVNLFALRSTDPAALLTHADPVGPGNDAAIVAAAARSPVIVAAWGAHKSIRGNRDAYVRELVERDGTRQLVCLGKTKDGHPRHPVRLPAALEPQWFGR